MTFHSQASNLVTGDTNGQWDVFVHDRQLRKTVRVSVSSAGGQGNNTSFWCEMWKWLVDLGCSHNRYSSVAPAGQ